VVTTSLQKVVHRWQSTPKDFIRCAIKLTTPSLLHANSVLHFFLSFSTARSTNHPPNARGVSSMISARTCYALHGMLVMIHVVLLIFSISHWEHRAVLPFTPTNNDFWPVVLSASLQAFYTVRCNYAKYLNAAITGLCLDLYRCFALPYSTACNIENTCAPSQTNFYS
jgi:hypothetical protein